MHRTPERFNQRQASNIEMPQGNADRRQAGQRQEQRVQPPAQGPGIMRRCNQKHETKGKYAHPLKNAQRTGFYDS